VISKIGKAIICSRELLRAMLPVLQLIRPSDTLIFDFSFDSSFSFVESVADDAISSGFVSFCRF
jgi:hypothetical protein